MIWQALLIVLVALVLVMEWLSSRPIEPTCSLDCRDGVPDENCTGRKHLTREDIENLNALDGQLGIKP